MNVGVLTIDFDEAGLLHEGDLYGSFSGSAEIDCNGEVIGLCLDVLGGGKPYWRLDVPEEFDESNWVCLLADMIKGAYSREIKDALDEWSVEIGESQFLSDREEHSTLRVVRGHVA